MSKRIFCSLCGHKRDAAKAITKVTPQPRVRQVWPIPHPYASSRSRSGQTNLSTEMRFEGTSAYVATDDLNVAVNAAIALERPLLVKSEPGTGKTVLALEIAKPRRFAADRVAHQLDHQGAAGFV